MPGWPSPSERRALDSFPEQIGPEDLDEHFKLSPADMRFALRHRGDSRLGVAVQLCALRWLGFVPDDLAALPQPALLELCDQLEAKPADLDGYGARGQTRTDQLAAARTHAGFREWDARESTALEAWLSVRATEHERPKALFTLAAEQLHVARIARPSVDQLVRLISAARERAHQATFDALADQLADRATRARLDRLLERRGDGTTWIEWLRTPARETSPIEIRRQLEKFLYLRELGAEQIDLSMLPPGRVRMLAGDGRRRPASELARLAASRRLAVLLAFCAQTVVERGDELIDLYAGAVQNAERHARFAVAKQRERTARARDDHAQLGQTLARILVEAIETGEDPVSRALQEIGETRLRAAAQDSGRLTRRVEEQRRDALWARHAHLAQFAPRVLGALDLKAAAGDQPLLDAIRYAEGNRQRQLLPGAPLGVLSPTYRAWGVDEHGRTVRTRYEIALWLTARDALRARRLYRAGSHRYGDPAAWMMPAAQWQAERVELAAVFDRPLDGRERLEQLQREQEQLVRALQHGHETGVDVLYDGEKIVGRRPAAQPVPTSARELAASTHAMLPRVGLPALIIDVARDIPFMDELRHAGGQHNTPRPAVRRARRRRDGDRLHEDGRGLEVHRASAARGRRAPPHDRTPGRSRRRRLRSDPRPRADQHPGPRAHQLIRRAALPDHRPQRPRRIRRPRSGLPAADGDVDDLDQRAGRALRQQGHLRHRTPTYPRRDRPRRRCTRDPHRRHPRRHRARVRRLRPARAPVHPPPGRYRRRAALRPRARPTPTRDRRAAHAQRPRRAHRRAVGRAAAPRRIGQARVDRPQRPADPDARRPAPRPARQSPARVRAPRAHELHPRLGRRPRAARPRARPAQQGRERQRAAPLRQLRQPRPRPRPRPRATATPHGRSTPDLQRHRLLEHPLHRPRPRNPRNPRTTRTHHARRRHPPHSPVHFEHINPFGHYRFDTRRGPAKGRLRPLRPVTYTSRATPATNATATNA